MNVLVTARRKENRTKNQKSSSERSRYKQTKNRNWENKVQKCMLNCSIVFFWLKTLDQSMQVRAVLLLSADDSGPQVPWYSHQRLPPMTAPEIGRSPHTHFLGPSLTQTV